MEHGARQLDSGFDALWGLSSEYAAAIPKWPRFTSARAHSLKLPFITSDLIPVVGYHTYNYPVNVTVPQRTRTSASSNGSAADISQIWAYCTRFL